MRAHRHHYLTIMLLLMGVTIQAGYAKVIRIGVVQTVIERTLGENRGKLLGFIGQAKLRGCHIVVFPEGALYWSDIATHRPTTAELDAGVLLRAGHFVALGYCVWGCHWRGPCGNTVTSDAGLRYGHCVGHPIVLCGGPV